MRNGTMRIAAFALAAALSDSHVAAQEAYDPNQLLYKPVATALQGCGVSLGVDPDWYQQVSQKDQDGKTVVSYDYKMKDQSKSKRPFDAVTVRPRIDFNVTCGDSVTKEGEKRTGKSLSRFAGIYAKIFYEGRQKEKDNVTAMEERTVSGNLTSLRVFYGANKPKMLKTKTDQAISRNSLGWVIATTDDKLVQIFFQVYNHTDAKIRHKAGTVVKGTLGKGKFVEARLLNDAEQYNKTGAFHHTRSVDEDRAYIENVVQTLQAQP